ncbi:methyltransferase domain-containing protein [Thermogymnomonas acidicola]|uniref:methyltransferase domain-containing protein n=1 Tax=Thermogymnomonas acidicola TaxID=399579 RepID=UPI0013969501|nr:methyltransferase domain-containing protein [Thermogymnomonas acidicola]
MKNVEAHLSRASELGFIPDGSVDFIFSHLMLCCAVDHRGGAVAEALRILRGGGGMIFMSVTGSGRKSRDVRDVDSEEWEGIMHLFNAFASGRSVAYRWFLGRKGAGKDY